MTGTQIVSEILQRIDDDPTTPASVTAAEALAAANEGQYLFAWMTLCLETSATITLAANTTWAAIRPLLPDYLAPLRLEVAGQRVRPATLTQLDALLVTWQAVSGTPTRYSTQGFNLFAVTPQPTGNTSARMTYARSPIALLTGASPEIPEAYHVSLIKYGIYRVKLKEGGQALQRGLMKWNEFLDDAKQHAAFVRTRSAAAQYDTLPLEAGLFERSRVKP